MFTERFILVFAGMTDFEGGDLGQRPTSSASQLSSVQSGSTRFLVFGGKKSRHIFWNHHQEMKTSITQLVVPYLPSVLLIQRSSLAPRAYDSLLIIDLVIAGS
jgi:hypothetical protein